MAEIIENVSAVHKKRASAEVTFGDVLYLKAGRCGPRIQRDFQLVLVYSGSAEVALDEDELPLQIPPGHVGLMRPGRREHFHFARNTPTHHGWCAVAPDLVDPALAEEIRRAASVLPISPHLSGLMRLGLSVGAPRSPTADRLVTQLGRAALLEFLVAAEGLAPGLPESLQRVCALIENRHSEALDLAALAHAAAVTPAHLIRLFHQHLGTTPMRHLWRVRVESAMGLLRETGLSIGEIADRTGFQNAFHLSRLVKRTCRLSPRALRQQIWNPPAACAMPDTRT